MSPIVMQGRALTNHAPTTGARSQVRWPFKPAIQALDRVLRRYYGVREFTDDPECIFRIALRTAQSDIVLHPGILVRSGEAVAELHLWNEQLPMVPPERANMAWGALVDRQIRRSLTLLAAYLATQPKVVAVHGEAAFGCQMGQQQRSRFARRYGFEIIAGVPGLRGRVRHFCDDFLFWGLTQTFNPHGLKGKPIHRARYNIWISCAELHQRYSAAGAGDRGLAEKQAV
jgi:YkoP domain